MRSSSVLRLGTPVLLAVLTLAACSDATTPETLPTNPATSSPESTTTEPTTTTAPTTTTTTPPLAAADLVLRADGIGPLTFGAQAEESIAVLTGALGAPRSDESTSYPNVGIYEGSFATADNYAFTNPFGRRVCYLDGWCASFGGAAADRLAFVGWELSGENPPPLSTAAGVTIGSRWADFTSEITVNDGGCYSVGYGQSDGISVVLRSTGEWFYKVDEAGNVSDGNPDPADVTVTAMHAGSSPEEQGLDC